MTDKTTDKWKVSGLLHGLTDTQAGKIARGLENQAIWLINEGNKEEYAKLLIPLARSLMSKLIDSLEVVPLPTFIDNNGNAKTVNSYRYRTHIFAEDLKNPTPETIERLSEDLAKDFFDFMTHNRKTAIYLYTPIAIYPLAGLPEYGGSYRAVFV